MRGPVPGSLPVPRRGAQFTHMTRSGAVEAGGTADSGHFYCRAECVVGHAFLPGALEELRLKVRKRANWRTVMSL